MENENPQEQIDQLRNELSELKTLIFMGEFSDTKVFEKKVQFNNNVSIGKALTKIGVYGVTSVVQASAISAPSGGATVDAEARTAINSLRTAIKNFGITL